MSRVPYWLLESALAIVLLPLVIAAWCAILLGVLGEMVMDFSGSVIELAEKRSGVKRG